MRALVGVGCVVLSIACSPHGARPRVHCMNDGDCSPGQFCVPDADSEAICMDACPADRETTCFDGSFCLEFTSDRRVCWVGGHTPLGGSCMDQRVCQRTGTCVNLSGSTTGTCVRACELDDDGEGSVDLCPPDTACMPTTVGSGFCRDVFH